MLQWCPFSQLDSSGTLHLICPMKTFHGDRFLWYFFPAYILQKWHAHNNKLVYRNYNNHNGQLCDFPILKSHIVHTCILRITVRIVLLVYYGNTPMQNKAISYDDSVIQWGNIITWKNLCKTWLLTRNVGTLSIRATNVEIMSAF